MEKWHLNVWQRAIFGLAAMILLVAAFLAMSNNSASGALLPFLWGVLLAAVAASPRPKSELGQ